VLLHEALSNTDISASNFFYDASTHTVAVDFPALVEGNYTLTLLAGPFAFRDGRRQPAERRRRRSFPLQRGCVQYGISDSAARAESGGLSDLHRSCKRRLPPGWRPGRVHDCAGCQSDVEPRCFVRWTRASPAASTFFDPNGVWLGFDQASNPGELAALKLCRGHRLRVPTGSPFGASMAQAATKLT